MATCNNTLQPGTIAHRAVAYLIDCDCAMLGSELADAIGVDDHGEMLNAMQVAERSGLVERSKSSRGHVVWSLIHAEQPKPIEEPKLPPTLAAIKKREIMSPAPKVETIEQPAPSKQKGPSLLKGRRASEYEKIDRIIELIGDMERADRKRMNPKPRLPIGVATLVNSERLNALNEIRRLLGDDRNIRIQPT